MKKILTILLVVCNTFAFAQSGAMADLKFEEAETAFNDKKYKTVLNKLDEFDKLFGSVTTTSLYLRIVSQDKLFDELFSKGVPSASKDINTKGLHTDDIFIEIDGNIVNNQNEALDFFTYRNLGEIVSAKVKRGDMVKEIKISTSIVPSIRVDDKIYRNEKIYDELLSLRKNAKAYLKAMESEGLDDKYREIYTINEKLKQYPKDKATWLKEKQIREAEIAEAKNEKEIRKQQFLAKVKEYEENKDKYYREIAPKIDAWEYKDGIKIGMDFNELKQTKKDWFKGQKIDAYGSDHKNAYKNEEKDLLIDVKVDKDNKVEGYKFQIYNTKNFYKNPPKGSFQKILDDLKKHFGEHLVMDRYEKIGSVYVIKSPYAKHQIIIEANSNTAHLTKVNIAHNFLYPYAFRVELLAGETAIDPAYLDRYLGIYKNGNRDYKFSREDDIPLLVLNIDNNPNTYYLLLNKDKTEFVSNYYREPPGDYGIRKMTYYDDNNSFRVKFDLEAGKVTLTENGKEYILIKESN